MANERQGSAGQPPAGSNKKKRPAPTIDLAASEIKDESQKEPEPASESARAAAAEMMRAASEAEAAEAEQRAEIEEPPEPRPGFFANERWTSFASGVRAAVPDNVPWMPLGAGAAGALVMVLALWAFGALSDDDDASVVQNRVLRIEAQMRDLARIPATLDPRRVEDLAGRVAKLEAAPPTSVPTATVKRQSDPEIEDRLGAAEEVIKALDQNVTDVARRNTEINAALREMRERVDAGSAAVADLARRMAQQGTAERSEVDAVGNRIAAAETTLRALQAEFAKLTAGSPDRSARLALAASGLRAAVERGDPFAAELAAVKSLGANAGLLAALEPFAQTGVPSAAALARDYVPVSSELQRAARTTVGQGDGILDRLQANAEKLVRIRPIDEVPGDDPRAIVSRVDARVAGGDLAAALGELAKLPPAARTPADAWIKKVEARNAAIDASRRVASDAVAAFARP